MRSAAARDLAARARGPSRRLRPWTAFVCLGTVLSLSPPAAGQGGTLEQVAREVQVRYARGEHEAALPLLREMVRRGLTGPAEDLVRRGIETGARSPEFRYLLGFCLVQRFQYEAAEPVLRGAVAAAPREDGWKHTFARCLSGRGRNREALAQLEQAIAIRDRPEYRYAKAMCALNLGDVEVAERELERCRRADPRNANVLYQLGCLAADCGEQDRAVGLFLEVLRYDPEHLEARFRLGLAESRAGEDERAIARFEAVLEEVPGHVGALYNLGRALIRVGRAEEGRACLERFREMSELEDQIGFLREFVRRDPGHVDKRLVLAEHLLRAGRTDEAIEQLDAARAVDPARPELYDLLAVAFRRSGRRADAERAAAYADTLRRSGR